MQNFRTTPPEVHPVESIKLVAPETFTLDNGVPVYTLNTGSQELIKLDLFFDAGSNKQSAPLHASLANKCIIEGTRNFSAREIAAKTDFYGAYLRTMATKDDARISLYCLNKHLDELLPVMQEVAFEATFPENEVSTIAKNLKQEYLVNMQKVMYVSRLKINGLLFGENHPYGRVAQESDYDNISADQLKQFYSKNYAGSTFRIIASGRLPKDIFEKLNATFGKHPVSAAEQSLNFPPASPSSITSHHISRPESLQSALSIGKPLFNRTHADFFGMQILNTILGGYFGSRLMTNIREDKGYTYGINSMLTSYNNDGSFAIASEVGSDVAEKAMEEIFKEIDIIQQKLVPAEELSLVKNYMLGNFLRSADGPFALSEMLKVVVDFDMDLSYYDRYLETIKNISANEIKDLAVKYLQPDSLIRLVVGK